MKKRIFTLLLSLVIITANLPGTVYAETTNLTEDSNFVHQEEDHELGANTVSESDITETSSIPIDTHPLSEEISIEEYNKQVEELVSEFSDSNEETVDRVTGNYAAAYDPRTVGKATSVKDQGNYGLCWDYAAIATAESAMIAAGLADNSLDLSELHAAYFVYQKKGTSDFVTFCQNGGNSLNVFNLMKDGIGPVYERVAPMPTTITTNTTVNSSYKYQHVAELQNIYKGTVSLANKDLIKSYITNYGGVKLGYYSVNAYDYYKNNPDGSGDYSYYLPLQMGRTNHAVEIVGWNDNYSKYNFAQTPSGNGAWLCKNSWGQNGLGGTAGTGYFWISYYDATIQNVQGIALEFVKNTVHTSSITLNNTSVELQEGETAQLSATILPTDATNKNISYTSSNELVATVNSSGLITAKGFGTAIIYVTSEDGYSNTSCSVKVYGSELTIDQTDINILSNFNDENHGVSITPYLNGELISKLDGMEYKIEDETIASVNAYGKYCYVYGLKAGTTTLTATYKDDVYTNGKTLSVQCLVRVTTKAEKITIENDISDIFIGDMLELKTSVSPEYTSDKTVSFSSSNENVAIVTETGCVIGVGEGCATITVQSTDGNAKTDFVINVHQQVEKITTKQECYTFELSYTSPIENVYTCLYLDNEITVYPENAYDKALYYTSSDESVIQVDSSTGYVIPVGLGTATIHIQALDAKGAYKDVKVIVKEHAVYDIWHYANSFEYNNGYAVATLGETINPNYGQNIVPISFGLSCNRTYADTVENYLSYEVSDQSIATIERVTVDGRSEGSAGNATVCLKILKPGKTTLTITANDDLKKSCSVVLEVKENTSIGQVKTIGNAKYKITKNNHVSLTKYIGTDKNVIIPESVEIAGESYKVLLGNGAFQNNKTITSVTLGDYITNIPNYCFSGCTSLKTVKIGANTKEIGINAFEGCKKLTKITIPSKVTYIGKNAFQNCTNLKTVTLSKNLQIISSGAFMNCKKLTKITIPSKVSKIESKAFYNCKKLKKITIKTKKLKTYTVGGKAFKGISSKATIKVPSSKLNAYSKILKKRGITGKNQKIKK